MTFLKIILHLTICMYVSTNVCMFLIYFLYIFFIYLPLAFLPCFFFNVLCNSAIEQGLI